jgi:hypothetical protein
MRTCEPYHGLDTVTPNTPGSWSQAGVLQQLRALFVLVTAARALHAQICTLQSGHLAQLLKIRNHSVRWPGP